MEVFRRVNCSHVTSKVHIVNIEYTVEALEAVAVIVLTVKSYSKV